MVVHNFTLWNSSFTKKIYFKITTIFIYLYLPCIFSFMSRILEGFYDWRISHTICPHRYHKFIAQVLYSTSFILPTLYPSRSMVTYVNPISLNFATISSLRERSLASSSGVTSMRARFSPCMRTRI